VKVAAHLEPTRLFNPADLFRLETGRSDQPLEFLGSTVVVGRVEEDRSPAVSIRSSRSQPLSLG